MSTRVVITTLNEFGEEIEKEVIVFDSRETAQDFINEHTQDFHDDPEVCAIYIE